jgi:hypothetical protein
MTTGLAIPFERVSARRCTAVVVVAFLGALVLSVCGCGPSIRRTEQSDNAFLRCFDMDYHPGRGADEKETCWNRWLERRVYNQPADKVAYAELRLDELGKGISVPGPPGPPGAFHERPVAETSGPAVSVEEGDAGIDGGDVTAGDAGPAPLPGDRCAGACRESFETCGSRCAETASEGCPVACEAGYTACMRSCFE